MSDAYAVLLEKLSYPESPRLRKVLENLMTPNQAKMAAALPGTAAEVAEKTGFEAATIQEELDSLFFKGVVFVRGDFVTREYFRFARGTMQLHDATQATQKRDIVRDKEFYELWHDFCINEWYPDIGKQQAALPKAHTRIVPAYKSIKDLPDMQPYEDFREIMKAQELIAIVPCACRYRTAAIGEPCECFDEEAGWACLQLGRAADYVIKRGSGIELSTEEALELVDRLEDDGLLHIWPNSSAMTGFHTSCQCCRDCCMSYVPMDMLDLPMDKVWEKSRYEAVVDQETCDGCQDCVERCHFDAIEMIKPEGAPKGKKSKKLKAMIEPDKCWGCGVCVLVCNEVHSLTMKLVRPLEHIPGAVA